MITGSNVDAISQIAASAAAAEDEVIDSETVSPPQLPQQQALPMSSIKRFFDSSITADLQNLNRWALIRHENRY